MDNTNLRNSAIFISKNNVGDNVMRVDVLFVEEDGRLIVNCFLTNGAEDIDFEECDMICAELVSEFPDIRKAEINFFPCNELESIAPNKDTVFFRKDADISGILQNV